MKSPHIKCFTLLNVWLKLLTVRCKIGNLKLVQWTNPTRLVVNVLALRLFSIFLIASSRFYITLDRLHIIGCLCYNILWWRCNDLNVKWMEIYIDIVLFKKFKADLFEIPKGLGGEWLIKQWLHIAGFCWIWKSG